MKIVMVAIDSKYIHTNLALRYLKANCDYESTLLEYTIKDSPVEIGERLRAERPDVVAFSVYLWNVQMIERIAVSLKAAMPLVIVAGGPEIGYDPDHYLQSGAFDYIIAGEGELAFNELMHALAEKTGLSQVSNLCYLEDGRLVRHPVQSIKNLDRLKNPYHLVADLPHLAHKIQYIELSRGCPFHCSYCLAALENQVRLFPLERVKADIQYLMDHGAKTFKFLDRTFNLKPSLAKEIFQFIIEKHLAGTVFQFEITGDIMDKELVVYLNDHAPKHLFRFEIGVQSTNTDSNLAVDRRQNNEKLFEIIRLIQTGGVIDLHLDLIAGLPKEDLSSFKNTFDEVFALRPKELQLGFLKMLRGTKIREESAKYHYRYMENPPYEILENESLSESDIAVIHRVEAALELYWNKRYLPETMNLFFQNVASPFDTFRQIADYYVERGFSFHRYEYSDIYERLASFARDVLPERADEILDALKLEYLTTCKIKGKIWWDNSKVKERKNALIRDFYAIDDSIKLDDLYKYAVVTEYQNRYLIVVFLPDRKAIHIF